MKDVTIYSPQELAIEVDNIDWVRVQSDDQHENEKTRFLIACLEQLSPKHAIRLLMRVIEAQNLTSDNDWSNNPFKDMTEFKYMETHLNCYNTDENPYQPYK